LISDVNIGFGGDFFDIVDDAEDDAIAFGTSNNIDCGL